MTGPGAEDVPMPEVAAGSGVESAVGSAVGSAGTGDPGGAVESRVARRRRALRPVPGRTAAIVTAAAVIIGVGIVSATVPSPSPASPTPLGDGVGVAPASALTSSLFCATGAGLDAGAGATGVVVLTNTTRSVVTGVMTVARSSGATPFRRAVSVPALGSTDVVPAQGLPAGATASTFVFAGGGVTGTMVIGSAVGWSTAPCTSTLSSTWDFAGGSTATGSLDLSLFNPTAAQAVVNVSFLTTSGDVLVPQAYQGITLGPEGLVVAGLGTYVQNQAVVGTLVQTTAGAIVATELDRLAVGSGSGLALVSGTPESAGTWRFAQTTAVQGGSITLSLANPGASPVTAQLTVGLSSATVTPKVVTVPGNSVVPVVASAVAGWPLGSPYSVTVTASGPVIVGRRVSAPKGAASPQAGLTGGTTVTSPSWLVVGPGSPGHPLVSGATIQTLAVANPGSAPVQLTVTPLAGGRPVARLNVAGNGLVVLGPAVVGGLRPLVVRASGAVSVEVDDGPVGAPGVVSASGFPLGG